MNKEKETNKKNISKKKRKVTKLVMKITSTLKRSYHCQVAPSSAMAPFDSFPIGVSTNSCPLNGP